MQEQLIKSVHNFMIVVVDLHLQVQTGVLSEMPVGVRVLGAEDRSDFVHPSHITRDAHLFSKLRTLGANSERLGRYYASGEDSNLSEVSRPTEIIHFEYGGARLCGRRVEFRRLNLYIRGQLNANQFATINPALPMNPSLSRNSRKSFVTPLCIRKIDWFAGVRRSSARLFNRVVWPTFTWWDPGFSSSEIGREASST